MKTHCSITSATLEFRFDPGMKLRVYVDCPMNQKEILGHIVDQTGLIKHVIKPEVWDNPDKMISDVSRNDLTSIEDWAQKYIQAAQRQAGWLVS